MLSRMFEKENMKFEGGGGRKRVRLQRIPERIVKKTERNLDGKLVSQDYLKETLRERDCIRHWSNSRTKCQPFDLGKPSFFLFCSQAVIAISREGVGSSRETRGAPTDESAWTSD